MKNKLLEIIRCQQQLKEKEINLTNIIVKKFKEKFNIEINVCIQSHINAVSIYSNEKLNGEREIDILVKLSDTVSDFDFTKYKYPKKYYNFAKKIIFRNNQ